MAFEEDFSIFFDIDDFGVECTTMFAEGRETNFTFLGIFEHPDAQLQLSTYRVIISEPFILCEFTDAIESLRRNDEITIDGRTYIVLGKPEADGTGTGRIKLAEASLQDDESSTLVPDEGGLYE